MLLQSADGVQGRCCIGVGSCRIHISHSNGFLFFLGSGTNQLPLSGYGRHRYLSPFLISDHRFPFGYCNTVFLFRQALTLPLLYYDAPSFPKYGCLYRTWLFDSKQPYFQTNNQDIKQTTKFSKNFFAQPIGFSPNKTKICKKFLLSHRHISSRSKIFV